MNIELTLSSGREDILHSSIGVMLYHAAAVGRQDADDTKEDANYAVTC
jgi:hypothetical protein